MSVAPHSNQLACRCTSNSLHVCAQRGVNCDVVMYCEECCEHSAISATSHKGAACLEFSRVPCPGYSCADRHARAVGAYADRKAAYMARNPGAHTTFTPPCCDCTCDRCMRMPDN